MMQLKMTTLLIIGLFTFYSCSKDTEEKPQNTTEILVQNSPWTFSSFKLKNIIDKGESNVNESQVTFWIYDSTDGLTLTFYNNNTGISKRGEDEATWKWKLSNNEIQLTPDDPNKLTEYFKNIEVSASQFKFEEETFRFDKDRNKVRFYGTYIFQ